LYKEILRQDPELLCYKDRNGEFFTFSYDQAMMAALTEIAGLDNIYYNTSVIYYYRFHDNNDMNVDAVRQYFTVREMLAKPKFKQVF
jgi:hypothetical protein